MALKNFAAGDNILVGATKATRNLRDAGESFYNLVETIESEEREWVALTKAAAEGAKNNGSGAGSMSLTGDPGEVTYEHSMTEDNRVVGSYIYRCSANKKSIAFATPPE